MKPRSPRESARERLVERLHTAIDHGDAGRARRLLAKLTAQADDEEAAYARWRVASLSDDLTEAVESVRRDLERFPESPGLQHALGLTLLEAGDPDGAIPHLEEACYLDEDFADAWDDLAAARGQTGDLAGMAVAHEVVWEIDSSDDRPLRFEVEQVERWAERGRVTLPPRVQPAIADVPVIVEVYPKRWILESAPGEPSMSPRLLGLFTGPTWPEIHGEHAVWDSPVVTIYQRNLERICADPRDMAEQVRITVQHELGHFLRLEEHELHERGLG